MSDGTVAINCATCGGRLAVALPGASAYCKGCRKWTKTDQTDSQKEGAHHD